MIVSLGRERMRKRKKRRRHDEGIWKFRSKGRTVKRWVDSVDLAYSSQAPSLVWVISRSKQ